MIEYGGAAIIGLICGISIQPVWKAVAIAGVCGLGWAALYHFGVSHLG